MAILSSIIDKIANCGGSTANTGKLGCLQVFGTPLSAMITKKGYVIPAATDFTLAFIQTEVQKGNLIPLMEASAFEDMSSEDSFSTNAAGIERLNLKGLPKYKMVFEEGHEFYRQLSKLTSFKSKGAILIDDSGRWLFGKNSDGDYVGLTLGQVNAELRKTKVQGGDAESKAITMQFLDRAQFDLNYGIVESAELGFSTSEVSSVNGVNLAFTAIPADSDTTLSFSVLLASDNSSPVEGLIIADFVVTIDGTTVTPSAIAEATPGNYALTVTALVATKVVTVDVGNGTYDIVINTGELYRDEGALSKIVTA